MSKTGLALALCFAFLFSLVQVGLVAAPTQDDMSSGGDAGNTFDTATTISAGSGTGYLDVTDEYDYYKVSVSSGQSISVSMTPPSGSDFDLYLHDSSQTYVDSSSSSGNTTDTVSYTATSSGYFYIKVYQWNGSGTYSMTVTIAGGGISTQNDMGSGDDAGNDLSTATLISAGSGTGYIDSTDTDDYYKVSVSSGQTVSVSMTPTSGSDLDLTLYDSSQYYVDSSTYSGSQTDSVEGTVTASGYFYIRVYQYSGSGSYSMTVTVTGSGTTQNDFGTGTDAGNSLSAATLIAAGSGTGYIDSTDTYDYYTIAVSSGQTVNVSLTPPSGSDFDLKLYDTNQSQVDSSTYGGSTTDIVEGTATASGYFYIYVYQWSGSGIYSMTVTVTGSGAVQNDMGTGTDAGNSFSAATTISPKTGTGYVDSTDMDDYYKVNVSSGQTISASVTPPSGSDFDIKLYDPSQSQVDSSTYGGSQTDTVEGIATSATAGYWYVRVYQWSGSGIYSLTIEVTGGTTQNDMGTGTDAGNSISTATTIPSGSGTGYIDSTDTHDYYKVSVTSGQVVSVYMTPPSGSDFDIKLYDTSQSQVDSSAYGGSTTDEVEGTATASGYFYIDVYHYSGSGIYSMTVTVTGGTAQNDMGTGTDASNSLTTATEISVGLGIGYLDSTDTSDYYKVNVSSGQTINVSLTPPYGSDFDLTLYDSSQSYVDSSTYGGSQTDTVEGTATTSGYFYIYVEHYSGSGIYALNITVTGGTAQNDMGTGTDAGNSISVATAIPAGSGTGYIDSTDTYDYYKVSVSSGQTVSVSITPPSGSDFDLELYDTSQSYVTSSALGGSQTDMVEWTATASGYFYINVYQYSGSGIYSMTVTVTGGAAQDDMGTGMDAGNTIGAATTIPAGSGTGYIASTDMYDYYKVSVSSGQTVSVSMVPPSGSDFDLKLYDTSQSQVDSSTLGGSAADSVEGTATSSGYFYINVYQYSGSGIYSMTVTVSGAAAAAQNDWNSGQDAGNSFSQAMMISTGTGAGYVDGTDTDDYYKVQVGSVGATISATLTPPEGSDFDLYLYSPNQTQVDSSILSGSQTDMVSHEATSAGIHYVRVHRYSGSGTYSLNVSVSTPGAIAESPHPYSDSYDYTWTIPWSGAGKIRAHFSQLNTESGWDYVYIYDENHNFIESFTGSYRNENTSWINGSTMYIRLVADSSTIAYGFTVDRVDTEAVATPVTPTGKYAVIVGINDYQNINGLTYAVNDAQDWKSYLVEKGYVVSAFLTDTQATEANTRNAIRNAATQAGADGTVAIVFSGHGTDASPGDAHAFCAYDAGNTNTGYITGAELQSDLANYSGRAFVFFDSCHSGGMDAAVNQAGANKAKRYMTTTCTGAGYGYDVAEYGNGAWTYWYLERGLQGRGFTTAEQAFDWASVNYPYSGNDAPQEFDGDTVNSFNIA